MKDKPTFERIVPGFYVIHHQRTIQVRTEERGLKWINLKFDAKGWERLIEELNNPPDIGIEVVDGTNVSEQILAG